MIAGYHSFAAAAAFSLIVGIAFFIGTVTNAARADGKTSERHRYRIEAYLDARRHIVEATEWIDWYNHSDTWVNQLYFHLYLNAFKNDRSVFMREQGFRLRNQKLRRPGRIEIVSFQTTNGTDLLSKSSTDLIPNDATQMVTTLPRPVPPRKTLSLVIKFRAYLPQLVARSGYDREFNFVAQWYPKLARFCSDGRWISFPYHGLGEFYADFARYQVSVNVPSSYIIGATGKRTASRLEGMRRIDTYSAEPVHDFAWCAYPYFERFVFSTAGPRVYLLAPHGYRAVIGHHRRAIRAGLRRFGRLFGAYPYETLTVIIPPKGAEGARGMEYPTLFVTSGPWFHFPKLRVPFANSQTVTIHELAHQWFHGLIANNEVEAPVLDEGVAQWASADLLRALYGRSRSGLSLGNLSFDIFELIRAAFYWKKSPYPSSLLAANRYSADELIYSVYLRPPLVFETARRVWGKAKFERAIGNYARTQRFRHPTLNDLFDSFNRVYWPRFARDFLIPALTAESTFEARITELRVQKTEHTWQTSLTAVRPDRTTIPTWIVLHHRYGGQTKIAWPAGQATLKTIHAGNREVVAATLDPYRSNLLDPSLLDNNSAVKTKTRSGALLALLLFWAQSFLEVIGP